MSHKLPFRTFALIRDTTYVESRQKLFATIDDGPSVRHARVATTSRLINTHRSFRSDATPVDFGDELQSS